MKYLRLLSIACTFSILLLSCSDDDDNDSVPQSPPTPADQSSFCYNISTSSVAYDTIDGGTTIDNPTQDDLNVVPFGFPFTFCGRTFNSIFVASTFDATFTVDDQGSFIDFRDYEVIFSQSNEYEKAEKFGFINGNFESLSTLKYKTTGTPGSRIIAIEWRNFGLESFSTTYTFNFTMRFYEGSNRITYHYGPNDIDVEFVNNGFDHNIIGLYAILNQDGLFLKDDPQNPNTVVRPNSAFGVIRGVNKWPNEGTLYSFNLK